MSPVTVEQRSFDAMWSAIEPVGRDRSSGGYRRFAWTRQDAELREWFRAECAARRLDVVEDQVGNQWGWWGDPDAVRAGGESGGVATGSHLDSVPDGGAFDGPLGVVTGLAAIDAMRAAGLTPAVPVAVVNFGDEEGARFGVACAGSRMQTGALPAEQALALRDGDGLSMADALRTAGRDPEGLGPDRETLRRVRVFVELHVEQGRALTDLDPATSAVAVGANLWPHGRWRVDVPGVANHAGTTRLEDRQDAMLGYAETVLAARGADESAVRSAVGDLAAFAEQRRATLTEESWTSATRFAPRLVQRLADLLGPGTPVLGTGAGHDAGILSSHGIPSAMLFVRNPTGVSHSPAEHADRADCHAGVAALTRVLADLAEAR